MTQALLMLFNTTRDTLRTPAGAAAAVKHKRAHSAAAARGSGLLFFMFYTIGFTRAIMGHGVAENSELDV
jgi:hypothetical protein